MKANWQQPFQQNVQNQQQRLRRDQMGYCWEKQQAEKVAQAMRPFKAKSHVGFTQGGSDMSHLNIRKVEPLVFKATQKPSRSLGRWLSGCATFLMGTVITIVVGLIAGNFAFEALFDHDEAATWVFAFAVWLTGLLISASKARNRAS